MITGALLAGSGRGRSRRSWSALATSEWDLAKLVTEHFNLPFLMAGTQISEGERRRDLVRAHHRPLDVRGHRHRGYARHAHVRGDHEDPKGPRPRSVPLRGADLREQEVLADLYKDYPEWLRAMTWRPISGQRARESTVPTSDNDWMSIFDAGDEAIQQGRRLSGRPRAARGCRPASAAVNSSTSTTRARISAAMAAACRDHDLDVAHVEHAPSRIRRP